jgi:Flp pilus assembly secretin CpaC
MRFGLSFVAQLSFGIAAQLISVTVSLAAAPPEAAAAASVPQVLISIEVVENNCTELRKIGFDWHPEQLTDTVDRNSGLRELLDLLIEKKMAKVLASPNLCMAVGRPGHFNSGSEAPVRTIRDGKESVTTRMVAGTEADLCIPEILANGNIRVDLKLSITSMLGPYQSKITLPDGAQQSPPLDTFEIQTNFEVAPNKTRVLVSPIQQAPQAVDQGNPTSMPVGNASRPPAEIVRLVMVTPQLADPSDFQPARVAKAPRSDRSRTGESR